MKKQRKNKQTKEETKKKETKFFFVFIVILRHIMKISPFQSSREITFKNDTHDGSLRHRHYVVTAWQRCKKSSFAIHILHVVLFTLIFVLFSQRFLLKWVGSIFVCCKIKVCIDLWFKLLTILFETENKIIRIKKTFFTIFLNATDVSQLSISSRNTKKRWLVAVDANH